MIKTYGLAVESCNEFGSSNLKTLKLPAMTLNQAKAAKYRLTAMTKDTIHVINLASE